jgi:hypothetical protein
MTGTFWKSFVLGAMFTSVLAYVGVKLGWG